MRYGYVTKDELIAALQDSPTLAVIEKSLSEGAAKQATADGGQRKRAKVTDAMRAKAEKLFGEGKTSGEVASRLGISVATVSNIKKALGLVKAK